MCGIAAAFPSSSSFVGFALAQQYERGPDSCVCANYDVGTLGINRLSITDLDNGNQPLASRDGLIHVVFNGAIYNASDLIQKFSLEIRSNNDGEVLPALYKMFGLHFADHLEGMYAIVVLDLNRRRLVAAVDPIGIKPLYWHRTSIEWRLASTLQAFPEDLRTSVSRVPPGVVWSTDGQCHRIMPASEAHGDLADLLVKSVKSQIPHEVPWACLLSGGLDSSLIASIASDESSETHTYSCGTADGPDLPFARTVSRFLSTVHHECILDEAELPDLVRSVIQATAFFEPFLIVGGVATYAVARSARMDGIKVLLTGEGADELFAGYDEFLKVPRPYLELALRHQQADLAATECLRLDRCTMANSVEARVPFLSSQMVDYSRRLGPDSKLLSTPRGVIRKVALRKYAASRLPLMIANREKVGFTIGSGVADSLHRLAETVYTPNKVTEVRESHPFFPVDDALSAWFLETWLAEFGNSIGSSWQSLAQRGIVRQEFSLFLPNLLEAPQAATTSRPQLTLPGKPGGASSTLSDNSADREWNASPLGTSAKTETTTSQYTRG